MSTSCEDPITLEPGVPVHATPPAEPIGSTGPAVAIEPTAPVALSDLPPDPEHDGSGRTPVTLVVTMGALIALAPLTIDTYLPALPSIQRDLGTTSSAVQMTLTGTLIGLALGQLAIGPWSDAVGRRKPLISGVVLHVLASVACMLAPSVAVLGLFRVLQGLGAAAAVVVTTAMVRDVAVGRRAATLLSRLMLVMGVAPILAPTLGSQLLRLTSWRGIFATIAVIGVLLAIFGLLMLPETLPRERRRRGGLVDTARAYRVLLGDRVFVGLVLVVGLSMGALFAYVAGSSFVYQEQFGLSEQQFGLVFGAGSVSLIAATQLNAWLLRRFPPERILLASLIVGTVGGGLLLGLALSGSGGLLGVLVPMWVVLGAGGLALPNAPAVALTLHGEAAGAAAALLGGAQFGLAALTPPAEGAIGVDSRAMGIVVLATMAVALVILLVAVRPWQLASADPDNLDPDNANPDSGSDRAGEPTRTGDRGGRQDLQPAATRA